MGWREIAEAGEHGADAGWSGFTYTGECAKFYRDNMTLIDDMIAEMSDDMGHDNVAQFIGTWGRADMAQDGDQLDNLKAWFALEACGQWIQDQRDHAPIYV